MSGNISLGFSIGFAFLALVLIIIGFATDHWIDLTVDRESLRAISRFDATVLDAFMNDPNYFSRHRGIFKVCYRGNETFFLDGAEDTTGNCQIIKGFLMKNNEETVSYEDEYDWRNHIMRAQMACMAIGIVLILMGAIISACGCWSLSSKGFRLAGLLIFLSAFFVAVGMACFHTYDYMEKEKIDQPNQGLFPKYWRQIPRVEQSTRINYGYSYIVSWCGIGIAALSGVLLLFAAFNLSEERSTKQYSEKKLASKVDRILMEKKMTEAMTPPPSYMGGMQQPAPAGPIIEVPVEVPVGVPVEDGGVIPVIDNQPYPMKGGSVYGGYGAAQPMGYAASSYGGYGYGPAPYGY